MAADHDDVAPDPELEDAVLAPTPPTFEEIAAALGLPTDARAVVITPTTAVAIAADYPEPHTMPEEASDGE